MLTTSFLACTAPRLVAPAMNDRMYADAATQATCATLRERGVDRDRARRGRRSPRAASTARAASPTRRGCWPWSKPSCPAGHRPWDGLRVLVTAGGTREPIDSGSLHRQPLQRPHGHRPGRGRGEARAPT